MRIGRSCLVLGRISPMRNARCPIPFSRSIISRDSSGSTTRMKPIPQLKTWCISSSEIAPCSWRKRKMGGITQELGLITAGMPRENSRDIIVESSSGNMRHAGDAKCLGNLQKRDQHKFGLVRATPPQRCGCIRLMKWSGCALSSSKMIRRTRL